MDPERGAMEDLPPGFRFHPTDEELVAFYLRRKASGLSIPSNLIAEIDLYKHDPWDLPNFSRISCKDSQWFFFNISDRKGSRTERVTISGYWKATGRHRKVVATADMVGMKKTLVFYKGRAPSGERTDWVMHEYHLVKDERPPATLSADAKPRDAELCKHHPAMVVCRIMNKAKIKSSSKGSPPTSPHD